MGAMGGTTRSNQTRICVVGRQISLFQQMENTLCCLAGLASFGRAQIIQPAPGMGLDIGQRLGFS